MNRFKITKKNYFKYFFVIRFIQVLSARSEQTPTNQTHFCPYAVHNQMATQMPAPALPIPKSSPTNEGLINLNIKSNNHQIFP